MFFRLTFLCDVLYLTLYETSFGVRELVYPERRRRAPAFLSCEHYSCGPKSETAKDAPFRINQLQNENFVSPLFCYSCKLPGVSHHRHPAI